MNDGALFSQISPPAVERSLKYPPPVRQPSESDKETTGGKKRKSIIPTVVRVQKDINERRGHRRFHRQQRKGR